MRPSPDNLIYVGAVGRLAVALAAIAVIWAVTVWALA
jgi:hypothetical protein